MCGIINPETPPLDGKSLVPLLSGDESAWEDRMIFTHWAGRGSVRTQRFRLTVEGQNPQLFDMTSDPAEERNVAGDYPDVFNSLKAAYADWYREVTAGGFDPIPVPIGYEERPAVELPGHEGFLVPSAGGGISYEGANGWANDYITNWTNPDAYVYWEVEIVREGTYGFTLRYACAEDDVGSDILLEIGGKSITGTVSPSHKPEALPSPDRVPRKEVYEKSWGQLNLGTLLLRTGKTRLAVKARNIPGKRVMDLKSVIVRAQ